MTMLSQNPMDKPDLKDWQVESLRITSFPSATTQVNVANWWHDLVGEQPENRVVRLKEGLHQDEGHVHDTKLILGVQPMRIDWLVVPSDSQDKFWVGPFQDSLDSFLELMARWFKIIPPTKRLAFGAVLMLPVEDRRSGYILIANYLPHIKLDPEGSSDFLYQINRPRNSRTGIPGLKINRLTKWSVARRGTGQIELSLHEPKASYFPTSESYACRLELDINTIQDYQGNLPHDQLSGIFQELVDLGKEIVIKGDIP